MLHELKLRDINVKSQVTLPVIYKGMKVDSGFRLDLLVEECVIVEIKSVEDCYVQFIALNYLLI